MVFRKKFKKSIHFSESVSKNFWESACCGDTATKNDASCGQWQHFQHVQLRPWKTIRASAHEMLLRGICKGEVQLQLFLFLRKDLATLSFEEEPTVDNRNDGLRAIAQNASRPEHDLLLSLPCRQMHTVARIVALDVCAKNREGLLTTGQKCLQLEIIQYKVGKSWLPTWLQREIRKALWQFARHDISIRLVFGDVSGCLQSTIITVTVMIEHFASLIFNVNKKAAWVRCVKMALSIAAYHPSTGACTRARVCVRPPTVPSRGCKH